MVMIRKTVLLVIVLLLVSQVVTSADFNGETYIKLTVEDNRDIQKLSRFVSIDNVDGIVRVSCSPSSSSYFQIGTTNVVCNSQDSSLNLAEKSFTELWEERKGGKNEQ